MMGTKFFAFLACLIVTGVAAASDVRFAIVQLDGAGHGVLIADAPLAKGASVDIQYPTARHGAACCKRLSVADFNASPSESLLATDEVGGTQPRVYRVRVPKLWSDAPFIGVAAIGQGMKTRNAGSRLVSVEMSGHVRRAGLCTSQEGVHLIERAGPVERTHLYLAVGYAIESPSCP